MLTPEFFAAIFYGFLSMGGGILGYVKSKSKVSLISGGISGLSLLILGGAIYSGNLCAGKVAAAIIALLTVVFIVRWFKTKKFMPPIPMIFFGIVSLVVILSS